MGLLSRLGRSKSPSKKSLQQPSIELNPSSVTFETVPDALPITVVLQHMGENMSKVCWKVRRADPKVVSLRPHRGLLRPGESIEVQVWLKDHEKAAGLLKAAKVAFKCLSLREGWEGTEDEMEKEWEKGKKKDFAIRILEVNFAPQGKQQSETETETEDERVESLDRKRSVSFGPTSSVTIGELETLREEREQEVQEEEDVGEPEEYGEEEQLTDSGKKKKKGGWFK